MATVFERLKKLIVEQLDADEEEITLETSFTEDLNADSLDLIELITAIEEEFSQEGKRLEMSDEDAEKIRTIQDTVDYLYDHGITDD
ncbi:MAG: acyl carrier protein [Dehalococcoidia bacterium]|nr:acyl carrier protein [Dehalococcoidia bacterium]